MSPDPHWSVTWQADLFSPRWMSIYRREYLQCSRKLQLQPLVSLPARSAPKLLSYSFPIPYHSAHMDHICVYFNLRSPLISCWVAKEIGNTLHQSLSCLADLIERTQLLRKFGIRLIHAGAVLTVALVPTVTRFLIMLVSVCFSMKLEEIISDNLMLFRSYYCLLHLLPGILNDRIITYAECWKVGKGLCECIAGAGHWKVIGSDDLEETAKLFGAIDCCCCTYCCCCWCLLLPAKISVLFLGASLKLYWRK